ncbi:TPA: amino acid permease, partial [Enterococcus faecium]
MKDTGSSKQITTMTFIGMTCALVASVRNIPDVAATSWTMIFYMLVAVLLYAFPIS